MGKRAGLGWVVAAIAIFGWLSAGGDDQETRSSSVASVPEKSPPVPLQTQPENKPMRPSPSSTPRPAAPAPTPPALILDQQVTVYTKTNARMRSGPSTDALVVTSVPKATAIISSSQKGRWHQVSYGSYTGWIREDLLTSEAPIAPPPKAPAEPRPPAPVKAPPSSLARQTVPDRTGDPIRDPYVGRCDCPYDLMRNGRRCGGNSAYSKPGGRNPQCYF